MAIFDYGRRVRGKKKWRDRDGGKSHRAAFVLFCYK
jgi:hypothetical protein